MSILKNEGSMLSLFKSRPLSDYLKIKTARATDIDAISTLVLKGASLHGAIDQHGLDSRNGWLARIYGDRRGPLCEETRIALVGFRLVGAHSIVRHGSVENEGWLDTPASLRLFALEKDFFSCSLANFLLDDAVKIARQWNVSVLTVEVPDTRQSLMAIFREFGFRKIESDFLDNCTALFGSSRFSLEVSDRSGKNPLTH